MASKETFTFTFDPSVASWNIPCDEWLRVNNKSWNGIASSALVYSSMLSEEDISATTTAAAPATNTTTSTSSSSSTTTGNKRDGKDRDLLVQRAAHDSMPGLWETPGGAVDAEDASILTGVARELWEEAGLRARHMRRRITEGLGTEYETRDCVFTNRSGTKVFVRFAFEVDVDAEAMTKVTIDPMEHQAWVWATEEEVKTGVWRGLEESEGRKITITTESVKRIILEGFRLRRDTPQN